MTPKEPEFLFASPGPAKGETSFKQALAPLKTLVRRLQAKRADRRMGISRGLAPTPFHGTDI